MKPSLPRSLSVFVALAAALPALVLNQGCAAILVGTAAVGTYAYVRGDLDAPLDASLENSLAASNKAIEQLKFAKVSEKSDALQAIIITRNAADKKIELRLEKTTDKTSKVKIRVGTFGDEHLSISILEKIKANL